MKQNKFTNLFIAVMYKFGNTWSAKLLDTGEQVWTQTRNGQIINGGINKVPKQFNSETGLSSPIRPNWK